MDSNKSLSIQQSLAAASIADGPTNNVWLREGGKVRVQRRLRIRIHLTWESVLLKVNYFEGFLDTVQPLGGKQQINRGLQLLPSTIKRLKTSTLSLLTLSYYFSAKKLRMLTYFVPAACGKHFCFPMLGEYQFSHNHRSERSHIGILLNLH